MKNLNILLLLIVLFFTTTLTSQDIMDAFAQEACDCISKKDLNELTSEQMSMELGFCIMESMSKHSGEFEEEFDVRLEDQQSMQKFGEKIGLRMASKCPSILQKIASVEAGANSSVESLVEVTGTIKSIDGEEFNYVVLVDENGRSQKLLWLRYFEGSEALINDPNSLIGTKVTISYSTIELYSPKLKDYYPQKEIKGLVKM